jgi:glycerate kinase
VRALACPASLKGVLSAREAAAFLADGFRRAGVEVEEQPVADGGEGSADVLLRALGGEWRTAEVSDPFLRPVEARYALLPDGRAVVEAAEAVGLARVAHGELDPLSASTRGVGELVLAALAQRPTGLLICLGGTATVDGGAGMREVLAELPVPTVVACDVRTPLLGPRGAARLFGPQKGATPEVVEQLEARLAAMTELAPVAANGGTGAAGGLGAAFAVLGARLTGGAELILKEIGFRKRIAGAALAVTGEGVVDAVSMEGKAPGEVIRIAREHGVPCAIFGGEVLAPVPSSMMFELSGDSDFAIEDLLELGEILGRELASGLVRHG